MTTHVRYEQETPEEVLAQVQSDQTQGLSQTQAQERLAQEGLNQLETQEHTSLFQKFLAQFNDFMIIVLLAAAAISLVMGMSP